MGAVHITAKAALEFEKGVTSRQSPHGPYDNPSVLAVRSVHDPVRIASESQAVHVIVAVHRDGASRNGVVCQVIDDLSSLFYQIGTRKAFQVGVVLPRSILVVYSPDPITRFHFSPIYQLPGRFRSFPQQFGVDPVLLFFGDVLTLVLDLSLQG